MGVELTWATGRERPEAASDLSVCDGRNELIAAPYLPGCAVI